MAGRSHLPQRGAIIGTYYVCPPPLAPHHLQRCGAVVSVHHVAGLLVQVGDPGRKLRGVGECGREEDLQGGGGQWRGGIGKWLRGRSVGRGGGEVWGGQEG